MHPIQQHLNSLPFDESHLSTYLDTQRLFEIKGPDAEKFLQGQVTTDLTSLKTAGHALAAHCNIKGQIISLFRLFLVGDNHYLASIPSSIAEMGLNALKKYSIFSKVELRFLDDWFGLALDSQSLDRLQLFEEDKNFSVLSKENLMLAKIDDGLFELWGEAETFYPLLKENLKTRSNHNAWLLAGIQRGIPRIESDTQNQFIPQMINLQAIGGLSFTKGCYTGQEIVTRLQHRGVLKKAMYRFSAKLSDPAEPNSQIVDSNEKTLGNVLYSARSPEHGIELLAVIQQSHIESQTPLQLRSGEPLVQQPLPYTLDPSLFQSKR